MKQKNIYKYEAIVIAEVRKSFLRNIYTKQRNQNQPAMS